MIIETLRLFNTGLNDGTYGINAQIALLDVFAGDSVPPDIVTIEDESQGDSPAVALERPPRPFPSISVTQEGAATFDANVLTTVRDAEITIALRYYAENSQTQNIKRNAFYTLRALEAFLNDFFSATNDADRMDNGVQICAVTGITHEPVVSFEEDTIIIAQLSVTLQVRDTTP